MQVLEILPKDLGQVQEMQADMKIDPVFRKLSKNTVCFHIWKVEEDRIESLPKTQYGVFIEDCTYIIFAACTPQIAVNQDTITREVKSSTVLERYIHFWLGQNISPQKSGNIVFKIMELDTYYDHVAAQYRETQGNESARFLSYFKKGITILSSSTNVNPSCKLFQITGRQWPMCTELSSVSWEHFSCDFTMILRTTGFIFIWLGRSSSPSERRNGFNIANKMFEENQISELVIVDDGYEQSMADNAKKEWNSYLPLRSRLVNQVMTVEKPPISPLKLYKCGYQCGKYRIEEVKSAAPEQEDLRDTDGAYIIDGCVLGVWIWLGKSVSAQESAEAMRNARGFVKKKKYPYSTPVVRIIQFHEPLEFRHLFRLWTSPNSTGTKMSKVLGKLDSLTLLQRPKIAAESQLIDDGSGEKYIYKICGDRLEEIPNETPIVFYSTECYILKYIITFSETIHLQGNNSKCNLVMYFWSGKYATQETRNKFEKIINKYLSTLGRNCAIVRIMEGSETPHFLQIFGGKFIVFREQNFENSMQMPKQFVLKVIGDCTYNSKAVQVNSLSGMSHKECYVIKSSAIWIWCGQSSTGDAREIAKTIGNLLGEYSLILESKEPDEFWSSVLQFEQLIAHSDFTSQHHSDIFDVKSASIYLSYKKNNSFFRKEILSFDQNDLAPENIYILDAKSIVYVWVGELSSAEDREAVWIMAKSFLENYPAERNENTAVALVHQGYEPNIFVGFFNDWDDQFWTNYVSYDKMRGLLESTVSCVDSTSMESNEFDQHQKYPLSVLQQEAELLPAGVDLTRREVHLTHDDFVGLFNMKYADFSCLPSWKKQELKKKFKIF